ncbi:MAG TPA: STAS domain-containing protein [Anaerolineae bacterium]|nr:STAS domain-containing protein [Anaerolineae bacterium]
MLKISVEPDAVQGVSVMKVEGRVDSDSAPELDEALSELLRANCNKIVVNLAAVDFLSSAGLRALVRAYQGAQKAAGNVRLAAVPEAIQGILLTVGLNQMLRAYPSDAEAISGF